VSRAEILDDPDCLFSGNPFKLITLPALKWWVLKTNFCWTTTTL
jgi:hypothetical protein